jgi:hypothetical protein
MVATVLATAVPTLAQTPAKPAATKAKPCPKGTFATTSRLTGEQACFSMTVRPMGQPQPSPAPVKPAKTP